MPESLYLLAAHESDFAVALAEADALLPGASRTSPRVFLTPERIRVSRSSFLSRRAELLARSEDVEELIERVGELRLCAPGFCIEAVKFPHRGGIARHELCARIGETMEGAPDLRHPRHRFLLVIDEGACYFGRLAEANATDWTPRIHKPFMFTASLDPKLARAAVNIVASEGQAIVDPCCGSGTIPIEAESIGIRAAGFDLDSGMPRRARRNARSMGVRPLLGVADACVLAGRFDAVVTNLPYGMTVRVPTGFYERVLANLALVAPRIAFFASHDLTEPAEAAGWRMEAVLPCREHSVRRRLHVARHEWAGNPAALPLARVPEQGA